MEIEQRYDLAKKIALAVGKKISDLHFKSLQVEFKDKHFDDPVTNLDKLAQEMIIESIKDKFQKDAIYAEENHAHKIDLDSINLWIIDPIDGTANFMHGSPFWGVSIAFANKGKVLFGIVYCPEMGFLYEGLDGKGSYLNEKSINVSEITTIEKSLITSGITHSLKNEISEKEKKFKMFLKLFEYSQRLRIYGSSVLQICEVAAGHSEAFIGTGLKPWDFAAANKILLEAGGQTTDYHNNPILLNQHDMICSNGQIHSQLLELIVQK